MTTSLEIFEDRPDRSARTTAGIITATFAIALLLLLWLIKIYTPIPPIPPDPEVPTMELFPVGMLEGGNNMELGGGSQGNTGEPGSQNMDQTDGNPTPSNPGAITNENSDAAYSPAKPTPGADEASVSDETKALLDKLKNKKNNTSINVGGDGKGSPYSSGSGDGTGDGLGPNDGGIPGPGPGNGGKTYRKILFKPDIANPTQEEGIVAVIVIVDRTGTVTKAEVSPTGSTTGNPILKSTATQSAYKIRFDEDPDGPELLKLTVNINFTLNQ
jgi:hypothetical protein